MRATALFLVTWTLLSVVMFRLLGAHLEAKQMSDTDWMIAFAMLLALAYTTLFALMSARRLFRLWRRGDGW